MKSFYSFLAVAAVATVGLASCEKSNADAINPTDTNQVTLEFDHYVGDKKLVLDAANYTNAAGEDYTISLFKYYVSNIKLIKTDGSEVVYPKDESYFLVDEGKADSKKITLKNIPAADYKSISFMIGVDSLKNTAPVEQRVGVLDMANSMYWSWNSGYIFVKMEGKSAAAPVDPSGQRSFKLHIGGYGGMNSRTINNIKTVTLPVGATPAKVRKTISPTIHFITDAGKLMNGPTNVRLATNAVTMFNAFSVNIANNYANMFSVDHVHN